MGSLRALLPFQNFPGSSLNPLQHTDIFTHHSSTAIRSKLGSIRDPLLLFLPPSVLLLSYSPAPGPSIQLTLASSVLLSGVHRPINAAFILCSCIHLHHHICCLLEPGSPSALYSFLPATSPLHYLLLPGLLHHHQWWFYIFFHVIDKDIKCKNTGGTLLQTQLADDLQLHLETCQGARF